MAQALVFLEHHDGRLQKGALGVLAKAGALGLDAAGVVLGAGVAELASQAGVKTYVCDDAALEAPLPQPRVDALAELQRRTGADTILFAASVLAADVAAGLASRLGGGLNWDLTDLRLDDNGDLVGVRPALGDTVVADVTWKGTPRIALVRAGAFEAPEPAGGGEVEMFDASFEDYSTLARMVERAHEESSGPSIEDADVIVAGGRGLGKAENFSLCEALAKELGGAVGATRAVVDAGWYPYAAQVGQTGKSVSPRLYIACGISGAIQHKVGMQSSGTIVAINKDANAPIFDFADLAVIGDVEQILPKLTEAVRARKG
jgi:electron transfer flavoprotein alpha subunit